MLDLSNGVRRCFNIQNILPGFSKGLQFIDLLSTVFIATLKKTQVISKIFIILCYDIPCFPVVKKLRDYMKTHQRIYTEQ